MGGITTNQGIVATVLFGWIACITFVLPWATDSSSKFMSVGPSNDARFLGIAINTWLRWSWLMSFTISTQAIHIVADEVQFSGV